MIWSTSVMVSGMDSQIYLNFAGKAMVIRRHVGHDGTLVRHCGIAQV